MSDVTITDNATNEILWSGFVADKNIKTFKSATEQEGKTVHAVKRPKTDYDYNGTEFVKKSNVIKKADRLQSIEDSIQHLVQNSNIPKIQVRTRLSAAKYINLLAGKTRMKAMSEGWGIEEEYRIAEKRIDVTLAEDLEHLVALADLKNLVTINDAIMLVQDNNHLYENYILKIRTKRFKALKEILDCPFSELQSVIVRYEQEFESMQFDQS